MVGYFKHYCVLAIALHGLAVPPVAATGAPRFAVMQGALEHDFNDVRRDQQLRWNVSLKNVGDAPAELREVKKGCGGCGSRLRLSRKRVPAGETVKLTFRFSAGQKVGENLRRFFVKTNAPGSSSTLQLALRWQVKPFLETDPAFVKFGAKAHGATYKTTVTLQAAGIEKPVNVRRVTSSSPSVVVGTTARWTT